MLCDKYKEALIEVSASSVALPTAIGEHVNLCAHCREVFSAQQSLFTSVDAGLRSRANVTLPANFDHRIRAALQVAAPQVRKRYSPMAALGSLAAAAAVLMAILLAQSVKHGGKKTAGNSVVESKVAGSPHQAVLSGNATTLGPNSPRSVSSRRNAVRASQGSKASVRRNDEPEVLVPQGQEELLAKYMEGIAARNARVTFSADLQHEPNMKPVEVPSIEISELVVRPLSDLSSN